MGLKTVLLGSMLLAGGFGASESDGLLTATAGFILFASSADCSVLAGNAGEP